MKILFVASTNNIFEVDSGGAMRNKLFVEALSKIGHVDVISFRQGSLVSSIENCDVIYSEEIKEVHSYFEFVRTWISIALRPYNPYSYYKVNKRKASIISRIVKERGYDLIACRYIDNAIICGLLRYKDRLIIDMDDHPANKLKFLITQIKLPVVRWKKQYEIKRIGKMAGILLDSVVCSYYSNLWEKPSGRSVYLHNTVTINRTIPDLEALMEPRLLYVGALAYFPSCHGVFYFVDNVFPLIRARMPKVKFRIVGKGEADLITKLNEYEGVEAVGYVEDIASEYRNTRVVVIPIYYGTGTCVKFVEGLMMNRPVVSTPVGARGAENICRDGEHFMLAKNDEEFANKTIELLSSFSRSVEMAKKGYEIAKKNYSQERFFEIVKQSLKTYTF